MKFSGLGFLGSSVSGRRTLNGGSACGAAEVPSKHHYTPKGIKRDEANGIVSASTAAAGFYGFLDDLAHKRHASLIIKDRKGVHVAEMILPNTGEPVSEPLCLIQCKKLKAAFSSAVSVVEQGHSVGLYMVNGDGDFSVKAVVRPLGTRVP